MKNTDALTLIAEIEKSPSNLNSWELDFVSKIKFLLITPQRISEKQGKVLNELYRKSQGHYTKSYSRIIRRR